MQQRIRLLVVDAQPLFREGLAELLKRRPDMDLVGEADSGADAASQAAASQPHVVLLDPDVTDAGPGGADACRTLKSHAPESAVIMLGRSRDLALIQQALRAGACAYVLRDVPFDRLATCIQHVHDDGGELHPFIADASFGPSWADAPDPVSALSRREREILALIAQGRANKEIGTACSISEHTVRNHISNIMSKLRARDRTDAAIRGLRSGLI